MTVLDDLEDAAKGAAGGAAFGPAGVLAGGAIGALSDLLPSLASAVFGKNGAAVAQAAMQVASAVTGKTDPTDADIRGLAPDQQAALRLQLGKIAADDAQAQRQSDLAEMQAQLGDVAGARAQTVALANAHSAIAWGAPAISALVIIAFGAVLVLALTRTLPTGSEGILDTMIGTLGTMAVTVVSYWVGSSAGSALKTEHLANSVPAAMVNKMQGGS